MTQSREYQGAGPFKRYLLREIAAGKRLRERGWEEGTPLDLHTLQVVKDRFDELGKEG